MRILVLVAVLASAKPADACSIRPDLRIEPTFVEEVGQAYAIAIAAVDTTVDHDDFVIPFVVREVFKGPVRVGTRVDHFGILDDPVPCGGAAIRSDTQYILFLTKDGHAREQIAINPRDTGMRFALVELVRITARPDRDAALRAVRAESADGEDLVSLIAQHLKTPTPHKSFAQLWPMLRTADRDRVIHSIGLGGDPDAEAFMVDVLHAFRTRVPLPREELHAIAAYFSKRYVPAAAADLLWLYRLSDQQWPWRSDVVVAMTLHAHEELHRTSPGLP